MKKAYAIFLSFFLFSSASALPKDLLLNWDHPSSEDLKTVQDFLDEQCAKIPPDAYGFRTDHVKSFKLFTTNHSSYALQIKKGTDSSICVVCYSSINPRYQTDLYQTGFVRLLQSLQDHHFPGDILYRVGGWPNMEHGGLLLCDTPYAFKACAIEEARRLGYQQVLWLDLSVRALTDLRSVFEKIRRDGAYFRKSFHAFDAHSGKIITSSLAQTYNRSWEELEALPHYAAGVLGLDLESHKVLGLLADWLALAEQKEPFKSCFPEQVPFSILVDKYDLHKGLCPFEEITFEPHLIQDNTQFLIQY